jgi:hypothetical protein
MSEPTYFSREEAEAAVRELRLGESVSFHVDPRNSHASYHYTLERSPAGLRLSCRAENHDVNTGYDGADDYSGSEISEQAAVELLHGAEWEVGGFDAF